MTANIIDGKAIAAQLKEDMKKKITERETLGWDHRPGLAVILIGEDHASKIYVRNKRDACTQIGIQSVYHHLPADIREIKLAELIQNLNNDKLIDGILLQLPLPSQIDTDRIIECISPYKDVDGFHPYNLGRLAQRRPLLKPCTPSGIMVLLDHIQQTYKGKHAVIVGASNIVGRPMAFEFLITGATVTICHRFTKDLAFHVKQADILVSAAGKPGLIKGDWIKPGATVIDVGINRLPDGTLTGDIEFAKASEKAKWITPVPGGVGPMTVAMLLRNTLKANGIL